MTPSVSVAGPDVRAGRPAPLTAAELDAARDELDYYDDYEHRAATVVGASRHVITGLLDGSMTPTNTYHRGTLRWVAALHAVLDETPDRRRVLSLRLARAEKYLAAGYRTDVWAPAAARYRAELATLDTARAAA
ncbi:hypothetical protein [Candidatus Frankia nodulisporulans]|uniref:hypothetical protein n=1 Tax=Candidatus Frankia nodulisporulans TaxID=2060052 RepID=UPI0013D72499|nr:hypothetical protein [Candidatus Frankia nodulisporulans]